MVSPVKGIATPRATTAERNANFSSVEDGFMFYNSDIQALQVTNDGGITWEDIATGAPSGGGSGITGISIAGTTGMSASVITSQAYLVIGNVVSAKVEYTFTASAALQNMDFSLPLTVNNFTAKTEAVGVGNVTFTTAIAAWTGEVKSFTASSGTQTVRCSSATHTTSGNYIGVLAFDYQIL